MNKKGQVLVMFVVLLPFILLLFGYIIDKCYLLYEQNHLNNIGQIVCDYTKTENDKEKIKQLALENDSNITNIKINKKENINIILEKEINSLFGNVIGINTYNVKTVTTCKE